MEEPDFKKLSSMHFYGWSQGLKTGSYYLRNRPRVKTQKFTLEPSQVKKSVPDEEEPACLTCSA